MRLVLDDFDAGPRRGIDHLERDLQAPAVVDADFGHDQRHVGRADETLSDGDFG